MTTDAPIRWREPSATTLRRFAPKWASIPSCTSSFRGAVVRLQPLRPLQPVPISRPASGLAPCPRRPSSRRHRKPPRGLRCSRRCTRAGRSRLRPGPPPKRRGSVRRHRARRNRITPGPPSSPIHRRRRHVRRLRPNNPSQRRSHRRDRVHTGQGARKPIRNSSRSPDSHRPCHAYSANVPSRRYAPACERCLMSWGARLRYRPRSGCSASRDRS